MSTSRSRRTRRNGRLLALAVAALLVSACATPTPVKEVGLNRETPEATYDYFKAMARNNQWAGEFSVFSPNFKSMLNQQAGRVVDLGDYSTARQTIASNGTSEMQMLLNSQLMGAPQYLGADRARITVSAGGRTISPMMVRMTKWELKIRGEDSPATGMVTSPGEAVMVGADGSITVRVQSDPGAAAYLRTIPRDRIEGFALKSEWFVDDFGGLEGAMAGAPAPSQPQPGAYPPAGGGAPPPSGVVGSGSPDA